nr:JmjC domain, JmjN domain, zinc finger, C2H2-like protein [Tanacetum cinerariifolium]
MEVVGRQLVRLLELEGKSSSMCSQALLCGVKRVNVKPLLHIRLRQLLATHFCSGTTKLSKSIRGRAVRFILLSHFETKANGFEKGYLKRKGSRVWSELEIESLYWKVWKGGIVEVYERDTGNDPWFILAEAAHLQKAQQKINMDLPTYIDEKAFSNDKERLHIISGIVEAPKRASFKSGIPPPKHLLLKVSQNDVMIKLCGIGSSILTKKRFILDS